MSSGGHRAARASAGGRSKTLSPTSVSKWTTVSRTKMMRKLWKHEKLLEEGLRSSSLGVLRTEHQSACAAATSLRGI